MSKKHLHPEWYNCNIYCDGKLILVVGATKKDLIVDIWSGNHPFYTESSHILDSEGRVDKFEKKYNLQKLKK